jgi:hypothetical protein
MADSAVYIELASASGDTFSNSRLDDVNIFPKYATQNILLGTSNSDVSTMVITSNGVAVKKSLPSYTFDVLGDSFISGNVYTSFDVSPVYYSYPPPASTSSFTTSNVTISSQAYGNGFYVISSSSSIDQFQPAFRAFDNSITTPWQSAQRYAGGGSYTGACNTSASGGCNYTGEWIDITLPTSISLSNLRMAVNGSLGYAPNQFVFLGTSNTGSNWDTLMSASNFNGWVSSPANSNSSSSFTISTSNFYNRYRLIVQRVSNLDLVTINYMSLDGTTSNASTPFVGVGTSNPRVKFHVAGKILSDTQVLVTSNDSTNAPGFAYNGDSNTGFFHPASGNIGFVSQGTEQIRFAGTGRLGVATSNPGCRVCVADYDGTNETSQYAILQVTQNSNGNALGNSNQALLALHRSNAYRVGMGFVKGSNIFGFGHAQLSNMDFIPTLLTINSNGNVGILNTTPAETLHVAGKIYGSNQILSSASNDTSNIPSFSWREDSNTGMFHPTTSTLGFSTGGVSRMIINSNVGIGTSDPVYALDVASNVRTNTLVMGDLLSNTFAGIAHQSVSVGTGFALIQDNVGRTLLNATSNQPIRFRIGNVDKMSLLSNGNFGVGTSSPSEVLHVSGGKVYSDTQVLASSNDSVSVPAFSFKEDSNTGMFHAATSTLGFATAGTEKMRIDSVGNVAVGITTNTNARLYVYGNPSVFARGNATISSPAARLANTSGTPALCFSTIGIADSDDKARIGLRINATSNAGTLAFLTGVSNALVENMCIDNNGNVGIGTTAPRYKLDVAGDMRATSRTYFGHDMTILSNNGAWSATPGRQIYMRYSTQSGQDAAYIKSVDPSIDTLYDLGIEASNTAIGVASSLSTPYLYVQYGGNIGIGKNNPGYKLDVAGDINFTGTLRSNGVAFVGGGGGTTSHWSNNSSNVYINIQSNVGIGTSAPATSLHTVGGNITFETGSAAVNATATTYINFIETGSNDRCGILTEFAGTGNGNRISITTSSSGSVPTSNDARLTVVQGGNVGIGTLTPTTKLDVNGTINATAYQGTTITNISNMALFGSNTSTWASNNLVNKAGDIMTGGLTISTTLPVLGLSNASCSSLLGIASSSGQLSSSAAAGDVTLRVSTTGKKLLLQTGTGASAICINSNNTIGINTATPVEQFHVNGKIFGSNQVMSSTNDASNIPSFTWRENSNTGMYHHATDTVGFSTGGVPRMVINSTGNVGIGTTSPITTLDVLGSIGTTNCFIGSFHSQDLVMYNRNLPTNVIGNRFLRCDQLGFLSLNAPSNQGIDLGIQDVTQVRLVSNGNFGIGTTTPTNKLHVVGGITACNSIIHTSNEIGISPNAYNSLMIWDDQAPTTTFSGIIWGTATRDTTNRYIQLTAASNSQLGYIAWPMNPGNAFHISFDYFSGGGPGGAGSGDGLFLGWYMQTSNVFDRNGYLMVFDEYNGSAGNDLVYTQYYGSNINTWDLGQTGYLDNSTWKKIDIQYIRGTFSVSIDNGARTQVFSDSNERSVVCNTNTWFNIAGFCGGAFNAHRIRNLRVSKLDQGLWSLNTMSNSSDIIYPYGNAIVAGNVGIATTAPRARLHITPNTSSNPDSNGLYIYNPNVAGHSIACLRTNNTNGGNPWLSLDVSGVAGWGIGIDTADSQKFKITSTWDFVTASTTRLTIDTSGNVGIGSTSPGYLLDVNGEVTSRSANAFRMRQANFSTFWRNDNTTTFLLVTANGSPDGNSNTLRPFQLTHSSGVVRLADSVNLSNAGSIVLDSGRDLIVTSAANWSGRLQLFSGETGGSNASQLFYITRGASSVGWQNHLAIHCDNFNGAGVNFVTPGGVSRMFLNGSNGNLGIGTTSALERLHVNGKVYGSNQILTSIANDDSNVPGFSWREDSNTGMYHPATSTLGFTTAGVARMFINSSGNVGIGLSNPAYRLDVNGGIQSTNCKIGVQGSVDGTSARGIFMWDVTDPNWGIYIATSNASKSLANSNPCGFGTVTAHALRFRTFNTSANGFIFENNSEQALVGIRSSDGRTYIAGDLGVGTTTPSQKLHVSGNTIVSGTISAGDGGLGFSSAASYNGLVAMNSTYGTGSNVVIQLGRSNANNDSWFLLHSHASNGSLSNAFAIAPFGSGSVMTLQAGGNVGIATSTPAYKLDIRGTGMQLLGGSGNTPTVFYLNTTGVGTTSGEIQFVNSGHFIACSDSNPYKGSYATLGGGHNLVYSSGGHNFHSGNVRVYSNNLYVDGNVGVGTTSPAYKLDVNGNARIANTFLGDLGWGTQFASFAHPSLIATTTYGVMQHSSGQLFLNCTTSNSIYFRINNTDQMILNPSGNFGIGTISPSQKLHVVGNIFATGDIVAFSDKRLKSNITLIDSALLRVHKLNGYIFNVKGDTTDRKHTGLIAQEVKEVLPEAIYKNPDDDMYSIAYGNMSGLLVQAIKEIDTKYKMQFASMKKKIHTLQKQIRKLRRVAINPC